MKTIGQIILLTLNILIFISCQQHKKPMDKPYVVVLSMDGFRWDYTTKAQTPAFDQLAEDGAKAEALIPSFPSKTFPNHYTLVTGLHPGEHGIVANSFYNEDLKKSYALSKRESVINADFYGGEPIWVTAEKNGLKSAICFWPGSEAPIKGVRPSYWVKYDGSLSYRSRLDSVLNWLNLPYAERPHLLMFYIEEPDMVGHEKGPESPGLVHKIEQLDSFLALVRTDLSRLPIADSINFIVLSDHGMSSIDRTKSYDLSQILPHKYIQHQYTSNPLSLITPDSLYADSIVTRVNGIEGLSAWRKANVPQYLHYNSHPSISEVVVLADSAYHIYWEHDHYISKGDHGYDPKGNMDMNTIFYGVGPGFKKGFVNPQFSNRMISPLLNTMLGIELDRHKETLKKEGVQVLK